MAKYMGCTIDRQFPSGMYYALTSQGSVKADTVAGIKELIRERENPKTETIHLSNGQVRKGNILYVRNMDGVNEEHGYRLYWGVPGQNTMVPALGLATSSPFRSKAAAVGYGEYHKWGTAVTTTNRDTVNPQPRKIRAK